MDLLDDEQYTVPPVPHAADGVAWLRSHVARFAEGEAHRRRRGLAIGLLAGIRPERLRRPGHPVATLAEALGLPRGVVGDVETVAGSYQPHAGITAGADAALARLVTSAGGRYDEQTAARIGLLVQACSATRAMIAGEDPPVPVTRRVSPSGEEVLVDLTGRPLGAGRHACPGADHARALVQGALRFHRLHDDPEPLLLPNAWDVASAVMLVDAGFPAIGTTSLGVAASHGLPDGTGAARDQTLALARQLARLRVPVSVDIEAGFGADPAGLADLAAELNEMGVAGVNIEDGRGSALAPAGDQANLVATFKHAAPELFVNARVDTHWLGVDTDDTRRRASAYRDAGADGVFVPGLRDEREIARLVADLGEVPLNLLSQLPFVRLRDLGVRRVSTGSMLVRAALTHAVRVAAGYRDTGALPEAVSYDALTALVEGAADVGRPTE